MSSKVCPTCKGQGKNIAYACPGFRPIVVDCGHCLGSGELTEEREQDLASRESLRQYRRLQRVTQRDFASVYGLSPVEYSQMENGDRPILRAILDDMAKETAIQPLIEALREPPDAN